MLITEFFKHYDALKRKAELINKRTRNVMIIVSMRIKPRKKHANKNHKEIR